MRVLVTGSRTFDRPDIVWECLDIVAKEAAAAGERQMTVVHGCALGADMHADKWVLRGDHPLPVQVSRWPADWTTDGKGAGWVRNRRMVNVGADLCLAFIRGNSRGATGCADLAERAGITTRVIDYPEVA